jgi:iron complex outermembrane receptor protein
MKNKQKRKNRERIHSLLAGEMFPKMCKYAVMFLSTLLFVSFTSAQTSVVKGKVTEPSGEAAIGVSVVVKGTTNGVMVSSDGSYTLSNVSQNSVIEFSSIGYKTVTVTFTGQPEISVTMEEDTQLLDELVVVGYGSVKKTDATGAVTAIKADLNGRGLAPNAQDMMIGKIAGVSVISGGGAPTDGATIRIRGGSSLSANNDPLIVVDGIPLGGGPGGVGNMLSSINPTDIETFTVLKDASATAIYGSRASNGVIIITTKKGASGKIKVTYDGNVSFSTKRNQVDVLSGDEFRDFVKKTFAGASNEGSVLAKLGTENTDWQKEIFRTTVNTEHNLSIYGGVKDFLPYRVSLAYTDLNGILKTAGMDRYTGNVSMSPVLFDKHLTVNLNVKGMYIKNRFADRGAIGAATAMDPSQPVYDANSQFGGYWSWLGNDGNLLKVATKNPVAMLMMNHDNSNVYQIIANAQLDYKVHFLPDLHLNLNIGTDYSHSKGKIWRPLNSPMQNQEYEFLKDYTEDRRNPLMEFFAQYKKELGVHSIDVMAGHSWQHFWHKNPAVEQHIGQVNEDGSPVVINTNSPSELYLESYFGRINYGLFDKYMFTFTMRTDGSSRFLKGHRWGLFPAAAFAWRMNEESFIKKIDLISNLKLRLGWGITGQQDIGVGDYPAVNAYQTSEGVAANYWIDGKWVTLIKPVAYNPILTWEKTTTYNAGLDFGFLRNRINGSIDIYHRVTKDLINTEVSIPSGSNFGEYVAANVGSLTNDGVEFMINAIPVVAKDFQWDFGFNIAYNRNEITELTLGDNSAAYRRYGSTGGDGSFNLNIHKVGYAAGMYYVYEQVYDNDKKPIEGLYVDRNNDGILDDNDMYIYHNATPKVILGFNTKLTWKSWDLSIASHGSIGNYNYNGMAANHAELAPARVFANEFLSNRYKSAFDSNFQMKQLLSDYYIQNASFYRIDNITLGYSFPSVGTMPVSGRVYGSVHNPFVFTKYQGLDPEISGGVDNDFYPRPISFILGVKLNF